MKYFLFLISTSFFLAACTSTEPTSSPYPLKALDLTHDKDAAETYWDKADTVAPIYPVSAATNGIAGCARFLITINSQGQTVNPILIESFPTEAFSKPSLKALKKWTWKPSLANNQKTPITRTVQLDFSIRNAKNAKQAKEHCTI